MTGLAQVGTMLRELHDERKMLLLLLGVFPVGVGDASMMSMWIN